MTAQSSTPLALQPPVGWHVRPVLLADLSCLLAGPWVDLDPELARRMIERAQKIALNARGLGIVVVAPDEHIIAYGQVTMWTHCAEISDLMVAEAWRSQGIGTTMIQYLTRTTREMRMTCVEIGVAQSNPRALALYERLGFARRRTLILDVGQGLEPVIYLRLEWS